VRQVLQHVFDALARVHEACSLVPPGAEKLARRHARPPIDTLLEQLRHAAQLVDSRVPCEQGLAHSHICPTQQHSRADKFQAGFFFRVRMP
jgi:hypothetical protein